MSGARLEQLRVGDGPDRRAIAVLRRAGASPGLLWLGGFRSDLTGAKAEALDQWAAETGHACVRFDYSGHGRSAGKFEDGTISRWLEEATAVFASQTEGPQIVVGSSMGGWLALLLAKRLREAGEAGRLAGLLLVAPAVDMTKELMSDHFDASAQAQLARDGYVLQPSAYADEPYRITRALIEDGERHLFGEHPIETGAHVHVIQGMRDEEVPWTHATALMERLAFDDAVLTLVRDGDHRLSRPEDIERLTRIVADLAAA